MKCANVLQATFDPEVFFNVILPPIIFNAGFSMKKVSEPHMFVTTEQLVVCMVDLGLQSYFSHIRHAVVKHV